MIEKIIVSQLIKKSLNLLWKIIEKICNKLINKKSSQILVKFNIKINKVIIYSFKLI